MNTTRAPGEKMRWKPRRKRVSLDFGTCDHQKAHKPPVNRCGLTGRPRAYYRKFRMSRLMLRDLAAYGLIPGLVKASW